MNKYQSPIPDHHQLHTEMPISMLGPIFGAQLQRLGFWRVIIGGGSMYLYIPFMVFLHTTFAVVIYQGLLRPLLGTPQVRWRDHVIIDRQRIQGLTWFDRLNCMFCGYANGVCTMMNRELDQMSQLPQKPSFWAWPMLFSIMLVLVIFELIGELAIQGIFNILVSRPLGMHRYSLQQAHHVLQHHAYGKNLPWSLRFGLLAAKNHTLRMSMALEQIESSWCPLRHFETRHGIIYPEHHRKFFGPEEVRAMYEQLRLHGTVSDRLPRY